MPSEEDRRAQEEATHAQDHGGPAAEGAGVKYRDIAPSVGVAGQTDFEYLARAEAPGLAWPLPEGMDEAALEAKLFPPPCGELAARRPVPEWREVHRELKQGRHVTLRLLWLG